MWLPKFWPASIVVEVFLFFSTQTKPFYQIWANWLLPLPRWLCFHQCCSQCYSYIDPFSANVIKYVRAHFGNGSGVVFRQLWLTKKRRQLVNKHLQSLLVSTCLVVAYTVVRIAIPPADWSFIGFRQDHDHFRATGGVCGCRRLNVWTGMRT